MRNPSASVKMLEEILAIMRIEYRVSDSVTRITIKRDAAAIQRCIERITRINGLNGVEPVIIVDKAITVESLTPEFVQPCTNLDHSTDAECNCP